MATITPTRMVLNQMKGRLKTASRGHKLLKDKRDELMRQFMDVVRRNKELRTKVEQGLTEAFGALSVASAVMSPEMLEQALLYPRQSVALDVSFKNIMSVNVPVYDFQTKTAEEGDIFPYGLAQTSGELDDALEALSAVCHAYHMPLFVDGARLGYALVSEGTDVTLADLARLTDVFYIGGTKVGALCGEAVVFPHGAPAHFMTMVKQQGALLAKGRLMGIQFDVLFTDGLYTRISRNAIETANALKKGLAAKGYRFFMDSPTNQLFVVLENTQLAALEGKAKFGFWEKFDDSHTVVRIATSWATKMEEIEQLIALM